MNKTKYDFINLNIVKDLQNLCYRIKPYKNNYLLDLDLNLIPDYFYKINPKKNKLINDFTNKNNLLKVYDVNRKLSKVMSKISNKIQKNEYQNVAKLDEYFFKNICKENIFPSVLGYENFPKSSCISVNNIVCHGIPYEYKLQSGDIVKVDICGYNGYHSDMANTFLIGKVSGEHKSLVKTTKDSLDNAISICKPGNLYSNIGKIIEKTTKDNGFTVIKGYRGHHIGNKIHLKPYISNIYEKTNEIMKVGDLFCIEPLLTIDNGDTYIDKDNNSVLTKDNKYSAHFERCILITESGHEILN